MDVLTSFLGRSGYLPHGYCFTWTPGLLWMMVASDAVIAASYFSISLAIVGFIRKRPDAATNWLPLLFGAFIFACGITHLMDIWTIWRPDYGLQALTKLATALISTATAIALWLVIPKALKIPSVAQLQTVIGSLEAEVQKRRSAEEHLLDTQQSLAVTLASIGAGFLATDRAGCVIRMNAVAEAVTGWTQAEALGHSVWEVLQREDRPSEYLLQNPVDFVLAQGITVDAILHRVAISRDGQRHPLEVRAAVTHTSDGAVRGLAIVFRDMSRVLAAEAESRRLAAIVESSNDAIIGKTLEGMITSWNGAAESMFGYKAAEAIGLPVDVLLPPERAEEETRVLGNLQRGERVPAFDTVRLAKGGRPIDVSVTMSPIRDIEGRIVGASKIIRDASQRRAAENARLIAQRLEAENRQIQEASRMKSQFLANMSHELRTPLNAIIGFADLMYAGAVPPASDKHHQFLGHIASSGRHLLQLINDVLDLSKVESGKFEFHPEPVNLAELVQQVIAVLHTAVQHKTIQLSAEVDAGLGLLTLDPARLKQVLYNYLSNAIKFTPDGGRVLVRALADGPEYLRIEVEDTGIGIAAEDISRLFTEFQQLDAGYSKRHQGTGLGLALTRRLVEAQGGSVGVRSVPGLGSVFHLLLPRHGGATLPLDSGRMLVITNDLPRQDLLIQTMTVAGVRADGASTGEQAVNQARDQAYDAITLDLHKPDVISLRVLAEIRSQDGISSAAPVVSVTMPVDTGGAGAAATFAITDVLSKPLHTTEVLQAMQRLNLPLTPACRVLVVDDDPLALDLMHSTLFGIGITAVCVAGGRAALAEISRQPPDAIILDLMMPEFDGFAVLDALRQLPAGRDIPVFIWTSLMLSDDEYALLASSAREILSKGGGDFARMLESLQRWRPPALSFSGEGR
ncbi:hypothetical protein BH11PSE10_BH11PSE10_01240 [soil metagenome]